MHSFEGHSNERACRKNGRLGLEQVIIYNSSMMGSIGTVEMAGVRDIPGSFKAKKKCRNKFILMFGEAVSTAGSGF